MADWGGVTLFAGPSAHGLSPAQLQHGGVRLRPPARRGDITRLCRRSRQPGVVVLCDGVFQGEPAVAHAELCRALDAGWMIHGVSSIGAIRAHELRDQGLRGHGWVYQQFERHADFNDDEMCLLHFPEPPYFPVSEALVNLRFALAAQGPALGITPAAAAAALHELRLLWFGARTEARLRRALVRSAGVAPARAEALLAWMRQHRIKTLDLQALLAKRPWRNTDQADQAA